MKDDERCILLMPMASPLGSEAEMKAFPLLGELCANAFYSDGDYHAFMDERGLPESAQDFVRVHLAELQLNKFDKVLGPFYGPTFTSDIGHRGVLSVLLGESAVREWREIFVRLFTLDADTPEVEKKRTAFYASLLKDARYADELRALRYNTVVQNLPSCSADHYTSCRVADGQVLERMRTFLLYAAELPDKSRTAFYRAFDALSADIHMEHVVEVYGTDADYGAYPPALCRALLSHLAKGGVASNAAAFYLARAKVTTFTLSTAAEYVSRYTAEWFGLDQCYRLALEKFYAIVDEDDRAIVEAVNATLDADYAFAIGEMNGEWTKSLKREGGTGGVSAFLRQQDFYGAIGDSSQKHVVIVSDGLRYEVAEELARKINEGRHRAVLSPGIAMLPSETKYGKPVLLPHEQVTFVDGPTCDIRIDDQWAVSMENRRDILAYYSSESAWVDTATLAQMSRDEKRALFKRPLVYVYHDAIDSAWFHACVWGEGRRKVKITLVA